MKQAPAIADCGGVFGEGSLWDRHSQDLYWTVASGTAETFRTIGAPWRFSRTPVEINRPPLKSEHAAEMLKELGHASDEIAEFERGQVV